MIKYHSKEYPSSIPLRCEEIAAHLDIEKISPVLPAYSLHTEYSYGKRKFTSTLYDENSLLATSHKKNIPQLWKDNEWAKEFAQFLIKLCKNQAPPDIIEIHPPFTDYTSSVENFVERYIIFEDLIKSQFPDVTILIENRCGSTYPKAKFLLSKSDDFKELSHAIDKNKLTLKFALDIPQLYTAHNCDNKKPDKYISSLNSIYDVRHNIYGVHLWGKMRSASGRKVSHCGDLKSYFEYDEKIHTDFLTAFHDFFNDEIARKLVLEVNSSNADIDSIIKDLKTINCQFI